MILTVTPEDRREPEYNGQMTQLFGDRANPWDGPCGHLVRQRPETDNPAHFHEADQYQIVIGGGGKVGGHRVAFGDIHYADGYSGYGPIETDADGLDYLTLRPIFDKTNHPLPKFAALAKGRRGRQHMAQMDLSPTASGTKVLFERPDGVAMVQQTLAPRAAAEAVAARGGAYWVVMRGSVISESRLLPQQTIVWVGQGETAPAMTAGDEGAVLLAACFSDHESSAVRRKVA